METRIQHTILVHMHLGSYQRPEQDNAILNHEDMTTPPIVQGRLLSEQS